MFVSLSDGANLVHESLNALLTDGVHPVAVLLEVGPHDEGVCCEEVVVEVLCGAPRADKDRDVHSLLHRGHLALICGAACRLACNDHTVTQEVLCCVCGLNDVDVCSDGMRAVLLLNVSELKKKIASK